MGLVGSSSTNRTRRGYLYAATRSRTHRRSSSSLAEARSTTTAPISSPTSGCGNPTTAA